MRTILFSALAVLLLTGFVGCNEDAPTSDQVQAQQQEQLTKEATAQTGMPAIKNFRERKLLKDIYEMRDQDGLITYTYVIPEMTGKPVFLCNSIGYGIPASTQYTSPSKIQTDWYGEHYSVNVMPQADPNGLFSPSSAEGTWVMCQDPKSGKAEPVYVEPRIMVSPYKMGE